MVEIRENVSFFILASIRSVFNHSLFVSLLSHFWFIHFPHLHLLYQWYLGLCQAQCVQSHQRQPMSEFNPNIYTDQWEPIVICQSITFTGPYTTIQPTLTPTTVVQGVDNHSRGLYCRHCYCTRVCWRCSSRIFHFSCWPGQLSTVPTKDESPHTGFILTPWVVSFTPPSICTR